MRRPSGPHRRGAADDRKRLDRYRIVEKIGAGGMGEIYRASDPRLERAVAVKVLPDRFAEDETALERFRRESKALAAPSHPNLLTIHDIGNQEGPVFAVGC